MKFKTYAVIPLFFTIILSGCGNSEPSYTSGTHFALGTVNTIKIQSKKGRQLVDKCFDILDSVEKEMSRDIPESDVARINSMAGIEPVHVAADTFAVIKKGLEVSALGDGFFDITIGPVVSLWGIGTDSPRVPSPSELKKALSKVDYRNVDIDEEKLTVFLKNTGMSIDLGAIAKGWAADRIQSFLSSSGIERGIINLGGNVMVLGKKNNSTDWHVGIQNPEDTRGSYIGIISAESCSVVTSGKYERYFIVDGYKYHHIFNPYTGYPVDNDLISVTIVAKESLTADAYSTLGFSLGLDKGLKLVDETPFVDAVFITENHDVYITRGLEKRFTLTDTDYRMAER